jgi:hypothetical protein
MGQWVEALERRERPRLRRELPCILFVEGRRHRGIVRDVSARGLFVETPGEAPPGTDVIVSLRTPEGRRFILETSVPYRRPVSQSLASLCSQGVGLRIHDPSMAYRRWVKRVSAEQS